MVLFEHSEDAGDPISRVGEEFTFKCVVERVYTLTAAVYDESQNRLGFVGLFNFILGPNVRNKCTKSYVPYDPATTVFDWDAEYVMTMNYTTDVSQGICFGKVLAYSRIRSGKREEIQYYRF